VVLTSGTYDIKHIGHDRYLEKARALGDFLVVGVDSDEKVRSRKGPSRPIVSEQERMESLVHLRHVDLVVLKHLNDPSHHLMKTLRPDVLVISQTTKHTQESIEDMQKYCGKVEILESQAQTSTTARIRTLLLDGVGQYAETAKKEITAVIDRLVKEMRGS
jgi:D-beta-D-heptose 7-phosphate kinase/D-beta-D-heptose 1-phosphate adenosyltransferase